MGDSNKKTFIYNQILSAVIGAVATLIVYHFLLTPASLRKEINEIKNEQSKLQGQVETILALQKDFKILKDDFKNVKEDIQNIIPQTSCRIIQPREKEVVQPIFEFTIELANFKKDRYYYLAHEINGLFWPKARIFPHDNNSSYTGQSNENGNPENGIFSIAIFEVDEKVHNDLQLWFKGPNFPGIQINGNLLAMRELRLKK